MCGISGIINHKEAGSLILKMTEAQVHRGPDAKGMYSSENIALGHNRLSIIDLSSNGNQPLYSTDKRFVIIFNGEVYNYTELKNLLKNNYEFVTQTDTEVVLAAWLTWGEKCLDRFTGMFAFAIWDTNEKKLFAARDRFGVKPFHYSIINDTFIFASEIKAIHATGLVNEKANEEIWVTYFVNGLYDFNEQTFWKNIFKLPAGHQLVWEQNNIRISNWYNLPNKIKLDTRKQEDVEAELLFLLEDAVRLRFISDVPVGVCLSGGLDSSLLLALIQKVKGKDFPIHAFTFYTGDDRYDELPWVEQMIKHSAVIHHACKLNVNEIPSLASKIAFQMDEPYGGFPTLGMSKVFEKAAELGVKVLLDGNGMDEGWGGYDYYQKANSVDFSKGPVQGSNKVFNLEDCLTESFIHKNIKTPKNQYHTDPVLNLQLRDLLMSKIPRSMRFADRNSMAYSIELREPFLDHRIIELGLNQPIEYKIKDGKGKYLVRKIAQQLMPNQVSEAPKRAVQTPQREWLASELSNWVKTLIGELENNPWFKPKSIKLTYEAYQKEMPDNSFYIWQMINTALLLNSVNTVFTKTTE
jgi:asparagine synthase (glutamine-hydrolysing)